MTEASVILVLLILSAFFSGSETALTAASRPLMHQLHKNGDRRAGLVNRLRERQERLIGAILIGNNIVNILSSALATGAMIAVFGEAGIAYATILMTLLIVIFGEIAPKMYAISNSNRAALSVAPFIYPVVDALAPFARLAEILVRGLLRPFGIRLKSTDPLVASPEELRGAIDLHVGEDRSTRHERAMLRSILDLSEVQVGEIMVHRRNMVRIDISLPASEIVDQVLASPHTRIPLWKGDPDNIVGVLHAKELLRAVRARQGDDLDGLDVATLAAPPWFVPDTTPLLDQLQAFRNKRAHFALVVDEYGSLMGIVTLEDILEEIVGEIADEHDITVSGVRPLPDGSFSVHGNVTIRDLNREFEWNLPDEEAVTVAGLLLHEARRIPEVGQKFIFHGFRFEVLRRQRQQIMLVRVTPPVPVTLPRKTAS